MKILQRVESDLASGADVAKMLADLQVEQRNLLHMAEEVWQRHRV